MQLSPLAAGLHMGGNRALSRMPSCVTCRGDCPPLAPDCHSSYPQRIEWQAALDQAASQNEPPESWHDRAAAMPLHTGPHGRQSSSPNPRARAREPNDIVGAIALHSPQVLFII